MIDICHVLFLGQFESGHPNQKCWPLDRRHKLLIIELMENLIDEINPDEELLVTLYSAKCIEYYQLDDLRKTSSECDRTRKLLNLLVKRSVADYKVFLQFLRKSGQGQLACELERNAGELL